MINIANIFTHITFKKGAGDFLGVVWIFFNTFLKFNIFNANVSA